MAERFIVHFDGEQASWLNAAEERVLGTLAEAAHASDGREVTLLLPGEDILVTRVRLPPIRQARRRLQAAAFALEDRLVSRVDELHFALAARAGTDGETRVLVVDRAWVASVLADCEQAGLDVVVACPDALALPLAGTDRWTVAVTGERVLTRTAPDHAFACEPALWATLAEGCTPPAHIDLHAAPEAPDILAQTRFEPLPESTPQAYPTRDRLLAYLLANADLTGTINLRQGAFARTTAMQTWWQPFKITAGLAATWLVLALGARAIESWQVHSRIEQLQARSESAFHDAFPQVQTINDLRVQAEQNIRALRGSGGGGGLFPLLQATAEVTAQAGSMTIQSLQYRDGALYLSLRGENVQALEALRAGFARQPGTQLNVESADAGADGVQIRASVTAQTT